MRGIVERQTALPTTRPVLLECHNEAKPILISSAQSEGAQKKKPELADKYRENAKRKEAGLDTQVNHHLIKDLKETEKYHAKVNELKTKRKTGRDRKDNEKNSNGLRHAGWISFFTSFKIALIIAPQKLFCW